MTSAPNLPDGSAARLACLAELVKPIHLTPTQRNIVRTLVKHVDQASYLSATEVADLAQVSQPSVTRFAAALGFEGYPQLRQALREASEPVRDDAALTRNEWQRSIDYELDALHRVRQKLEDETEIREVAELLTAGKPLVVVGHRSAGSIAQYLFHFAAQFLDDVRLLPTPGEADLDALIHARAAGATTVLVIVFPRYPEESLTLMDQAKELGLEVICLTDSLASVAIPHADRTLIAPVDSSLVFDSYAIPMIVANVLLAAMTEVNLGAAQTRLEHYDVIAERYQLFRE
jgi:DNA-binding MurR/RpiR family transcriptional regulator